MDLIDAWAQWETGQAEQILPGDEEVVDHTWRGRDYSVTISSWVDAIARPDFCQPGDKKFHIGLIPQPFMGDLLNASVYILLLNPGLGPSDYYGEFEVSGFRETLLRNLEQDFESETAKFLFLRPHFSWHGGFSWWHKKLHGVIEEISSHSGCSYSGAREIVANKIASIELCPYHSGAFRYGKWMEELRSVQLVRQFVNSFVMDRVRNGKAILIATRAVRLWRLKNAPDNGVIVYSPGEARGASLSPNSRGGKAMLKQLVEGITS